MTDQHPQVKSTGLEYFHLCDLFSNPEQAAAEIISCGADVARRALHVWDYLERKSHRASGQVPWEFFGRSIQEQLTEVDGHTQISCNGFVYPYQAPVVKDWQLIALPVKAEAPGIDNLTVRNPVSKAALTEQPSVPRTTQQALALPGLELPDVSVSSKTKWILLVLSDDYDFVAVHIGEACIRPSGQVEWQGPVDTLHPEDFDTGELQEPPANTTSPTADALDINVRASSTSATQAPDGTNMV